MEIHEPSLARPFTFGQSPGLMTNAQAALIASAVMEAGLLRGGAESTVMVRASRFAAWLDEQEDDDGR